MWVVCEGGGSDGGRVALILMAGDVSREDVISIWFCWLRNRRGAP
jgi:hypothetical protein